MGGGSGAKDTCTERGMSHARHNKKKEGGGGDETILCLIKHVRSLFSLKELEESKPTRSISSQPLYSTRFWMGISVLSKR